MTSMLNDLSLVTCPTDDAIIEALPLTDGNPSCPPEPTISDDDTMGPFIIVPGNDYLLDGHESNK